MKLPHPKSPRPLFAGEEGARRVSGGKVRASPRSPPKSSPKPLPDSAISHHSTTAPRTTHALQATPSAQHPPRSPHAARRPLPQSICTPNTQNPQRTAPPEPACETSHQPPGSATNPKAAPPPASAPAATPAPAQRWPTPFHAPGHHTARYHARRNMRTLACCHTLTFPPLTRRAPSSPAKSGRRDTCLRFPARDCGFAGS